MIHKKVEEALNKQIAHEAYACSSYLSMASWAEREGFRGCAKFFYAQSDEEREHMLKIFKYVNEAGGYAVMPVVKEPPSEYKSLADLFETSFEQESAVTKQINKIVDLSLSEKDFAAFAFLQWFVGEQVEEEKLFRTTLDIIKLGGRDGRSQLIIDDEIGDIKAEEEKE